MLDAGADITVVLLSSDVEPDEEPAQLAKRFANRGDQVLRVEARAFGEAAETDTPPGILAIAPFPQIPLEIPESEPPLILIADQIRDPGNLGTLIRSAHGAGGHAVLIGPGSVDPYSPKVIRAAMGSHFRLPLEMLDWNEGHPSLRNCTVYAADSRADLSYDAVDWGEPVAVIVGNESSGLSAGARSWADTTVGIPLAKGLESLNAAIAGSVLLFEAARRRRKG